MPQTRPPTLPVWAESGDKTQPSNAEIQTGWPLSTIPPSRQRFNWFMNFIGNLGRYLLQFGIAEWDANESYPIAGKCMYNGLTYKALQAGANQQPDISPTYWERWGFSATEISAQNGAVLSKSVAGAVDVTLTAAEASNGIINLTGALTGNINVIVPAAGRKWVFINSTTGAFTLKVKTPSGTGIFVTQGNSANLICDGTNVRSANSIKRTSVAATSNGQTAYSLDYNVGACWVTRNGVSVAFTGTNGTSITLASGAGVVIGDVIEAFSI